MSSLSQQLKGLGNNNASVAIDRKSRSRIHSRSLIFEPKVASTQDYDYIHQIGLEGFEELEEFEPRFRSFKETLFSQTSIDFDRNVQSKETIDNLNRTIDAFLKMIGPFYRMESAVKSLEWLVRRFQINIHNGEMILLTALPYYRYPIFVRILNVIPKNQFPKLFEWVIGYKDQLRNPPSTSILKAFHDNIEFVKLYSSFLIDLLDSKTVYKDQLVFFLANAVQLIASYSKRLDVLNENYMPLLLEVIGNLLLIEKKSRYSEETLIDKKLTAYSLISVLGSVVPLSDDLLISLTDSILQDPFSLDPSVSKQTFIVLGQLWNFYGNDVSEIPSLRKLMNNIGGSINLIDQLVEDGYKMNKFLIYSFISSLPDLDAFKIFNFINLNESEKHFKAITNKLIENANTSNEIARVHTGNTLECLLKANHELFNEVLKQRNLKINELEMLLMTALDANESINDADTEYEGNDFGDVDLTADMNEGIENWDSTVTKKESFFHSDFSEFNRLSKILLKGLIGHPLKTQKSIISCFSKKVFQSPESSFSFFITLSLTPSVPLASRLLSLSFIKKRLKEISASLEKIDIYLLIPILLLGIYESHRYVRQLFIELMDLVHEVCNRNNSSKGKRKPVLFMEKHIYGNMEMKDRAIIAPQIALAATSTLANESSINDAVTDRERGIEVIFQLLSNSKTSNAKKSNALLIRTFVMSQWSLPFLPLAMKWKAWRITAKFNTRDPDLRQFFLDSDLTNYFLNRSTFQKESELEKIDFDEVEDSIVSLVGGSSSHQKNAVKEVDWFLEALDSRIPHLQLSTSNQIIKVFDTIKSTDLKMKLINKFVDMSLEDEPTSFDVIDTLSKLKMDHDLVLAVLNGVQIGSTLPEQGLAKRRRKSSNSTRQAMARDDISNLAAVHLKKLTAILDLLNNKLRDNDNEISQPDLLKAFFKILTDLEYLGNDGNLPILYPQEILASCMLLCVSQIKRSSLVHKFDSNSVRADLIVNSIRSSSSPEVQNRLMLVIAELASLSPETILHAVMPIFTFMGVHTVRQDDEFSSVALQKTISKVIPALAASGSSTLNYEVEFLLTSFVTAFQHIPRHRRVNLFSSLTKTLGYEKSLHIILFLMGQHYSRNLEKGKTNDCRSLLEFTSSFMKIFSAEQQLFGISKYFELWEQIPVAQLESGSEEYTKLSTRAIFGASVLSLSDDGLVSLKADLLTFLCDVIRSPPETKFSFNNGLSLKAKLSISLLDPELSLSDSANSLKEFRKNTALILSSLEKFIDTSSCEKIADRLFDLLDVYVNLLPLDYFLDSAIASMDVGKTADPLSMRVSKNFALLTIRKLEEELNSDSYNENIKLILLNKMLPTLLELINSSHNIELEQSCLDMLAVIVTKLGSFTNDLALPENARSLTEFLPIITKEQGLLNSQPEIIISAIYAITSIVNVLGVKSIGFFPQIVPPILKIWESTKGSEDDSSKLVQPAILFMLSSLIKKLPAFMTSYLNSILLVVIMSDLTDYDLRSTVLSLVVEHIDLSQLLRATCNLWWNEKFYACDSAANIGLYLNTLQRIIDKIDKKSAISQATVFLKWMIQVFEFRNFVEESNNKFDNNTIHRLESSFHSCSISFVMKLNDKTFRPLFANLVRWATNGEGSQVASATKVSRLLAFFRFFNKLQEELKSIITSYYSYLLDEVSSLLTEFSDETLVNTNLRRMILISLTSSFKYDQDDYWSQQLRFDSLFSPLMKQLVNIEDSIGKYLVKCIAAFVVDVSSEEYNELIIKELISYISNENDSTSPKSKIWTIRILKTIFQKMGEQWLLFLPTMVPYIAELLEDDDTSVEMEVRSGLVRVIENVLGEPLDRYLD
ncbi:uncharacterized protein PRCAT00005886001 [Priceomyces carsonii]|uniref:uncharacterized protein n=1 Tax=Priceomyces carsonii TaxID=28549 RepID=UPI002ED89A75|nr:unnamed protein product [Priceomyces carsonii]